MADLSAFPITTRWPAQTPDILQLYSTPTPNGVKVSIMLEELGIKYRNTTGGARIATRHFSMCFSIADQCKRLCFASRSGGRRNRNHGKHVARCFADAVVVVDRPTAGVDKVNAFATVHAATSSQTNQQIRFYLFGTLYSCVNHC